MPVDVFIKTQGRTALSYLLKFFWDQAGAHSRSAEPPLARGMERAGGLVSRGGFNVTDPRIVEARKIRQMQLVFDGEAVVRGLMASQISCSA